jgi:putative YphP/YqiW family bacilliredoxin
MYDQSMVEPMIKELTDHGFESLTDANSVTEKLEKMSGTALVVVNSICGCAAGSARPGIVKSLENSIKPENLYTVFAGQYSEATNTARNFFHGFTPSSPSIALMKDGQVIHMLERTDIEGNDANSIAGTLSTAYNRHCETITPETTIETLSERFPDFSAKIIDLCGTTAGALSSISGKPTQELIYAIEDILDAEPDIIPVSFTPEGAAKFKEFREKEGQSNAGIGLNGQGMGFKEENDSDDLVFEYEDIKIFVEKKSAKRYSGKKVHFSEAPQGGGFSLI